MNPNNLGEVEGISTHDYAKGYVGAPTANTKSQTIETIDECQKLVSSIRTKLSLVLRPFEESLRAQTNTGLQQELDSLRANLFELDNAIEL